MADEVEMAEQQAAVVLAAQIAYRKPEPGAHTGFCLFCNEAIQIPARYCDADCAEDHEKEIRFRQ